MFIITVGGVLIGLTIVPAREGGDPVVRRGCVGECSHAFPSWLWPTAFAVLALLWLALLQVIIMRPSRRAGQSARGQMREPAASRQSVANERDAEGWYVDPFNRHQHRWISKGKPSALVRDGGVESNDPPPAMRPTGPFVPATVNRSSNGEDLRRVGDAGSEAYDPGAAHDAVLDASTWFPFN